MKQEKIDRINALAHKAKTEGLTPEELAERDALRREYIDAVTGNLRRELEALKAKEAAGGVDALLASAEAVGPVKALAAKVEQDEDLVDRYEDKIGTYLMKLNGSELRPEENDRVTEYLHTLSDFERISDHAMNVAQAAQEIHDKKIHFSADGEHELTVLLGAVNEILELTINGFVEDDLDKAYRVEPLEEHIDVLCDELKLRHVERLQTGACSLKVGFVFNDLLTNFERVADHCSNIAIAMIELSQNAYETHDYIINLKELHSHNYDELYAGFAEKYAI